MPRQQISESLRQVQSRGPAIWPESGLCPLCGRPMTKGPSVNDHHLVPKSRGGHTKYAIHRVCHSKIHSVFSESELAHEYHSFEKIRQHPEIAEFIHWVRKQPPEFNTKHRRKKA